MLKKLRHKKMAKKVWIALAILILPAFVFWGLGEAIKSRQESAYAGKILGKKVSLLEYKDAMEAVKNQAIMQFGDRFSEMRQYLNLESRAWERIILLREAKTRKIKVSDAEVIELIESYPFFQRKGSFDNRIYAEMLQYVFRTQSRIFEEEIRANLMLAKLYQELTDNLDLTEEEIKEEYRKANEEISLYYISGVPADFQKDILPSEPDISEYFSKNPLDFKQPLSFNLEYISFDAEDKIKTILSRLNKKEELGKIAKDLGLKAKETGVFTQNESIPGIGWMPEILSLLSKSNIGGVLPPVRIDKSYYILKLKEKKEPYIPDFAMIKDKVKEEFVKKKAYETAKEKIENCLKELNQLYQGNRKSADFNKLAKIYGLKSDSTQLFKYGSYIEGVGASDNFWLEAQKLKAGDSSGIIDMGLNGIYIIKLKSKVTIDNQKFAAEKTDFAKRLLLQKKEEYFTKFSEELKRKAQIF